MEYEFKHNKIQQLFDENVEKLMEDDYEIDEQIQSVTSCTSPTS